MFFINKKAFFLLLIALSCLIVPISAQNKEKNKQKNQTKSSISAEKRKQSALFADALREFYSEDYTSAERDFRQVLAKDAKNDAVYFMLARIRKVSKDYAGAAYYLNEALKINKSNEWYKIDLAEVYDLMGDYKQSSKLWEEICKLKPENEFYLITLSDAYINMEQYTKVIDVYNRLEVLEGYNEDITAAKATIWLYVNDIKHAIAEYDKLIKEFPSEPRYYVLAGNIYQANNMSDKALAYYQQALKLDPDNSLANMAMADYYNTKGDAASTFSALQKAFADTEIDISEKLPFLKTYLGRAVKTPNPTTVGQCEQLALTLTTAHPDRVEGFASMATIKMLCKQHNEAKQYFEQALAIEGATYTLWEDYFYCLSLLKDYETMISKGEEVLTLFPTNASMLYNIANAYFAEKQYSKAIELLQEAAIYTYDNNLQANIYNVLGDCHEALGNEEEAIKNWKIALRKGLDTQKKIDNATN